MQTHIKQYPTTTLHATCFVNLFFFNFSVANFNLTTGELLEIFIIYVGLVILFTCLCQCFLKHKACTYAEDQSSEQKNEEDGWGNEDDGKQNKK